MMVREPHQPGRAQNLDNHLLKLLSHHLERLIGSVKMVVALRSEFKNRTEHDARPSRASAPVAASGRVSGLGPRPPRSIDSRSSSRLSPKLDIINRYPCIPHMLERHDLPHSLIGLDIARWTQLITLRLELDLGMRVARPL